MPKVPCRKFTLLDAMILVVASAVVMLGVRYLFSDDPNHLSRSILVAIYDRWPEWLSLGHAVAGLVLMVASMTLVVFRVWGPRPAIRRVMRQPGSVACFFVVAYSLMRQSVRAVGEWVMSFSPAPSRLFFPGGSSIYDEPFSVSSMVWYYLGPMNHSEVPFMVAAAWIFLWVGRVGRPEPGWIDRSGRVVGWSWIAWGLVGAFH